MRQLVGPYPVRSGAHFAWTPPSLGPAAPLAGVLLLTLFLLWMNPIGYRGGGGDDWHYLLAARCAAIHGFCLPIDHWESRFPLIAPLGAGIALLGETRHTLWVIPLAYALAAIVLFVVVVQRQFGRLEALLAGLVLVATPVVTDRLLRLNVDIPELAFALAAVFCVQSAGRSGRTGWIVAAGAMLGLAIQSRATALALVPLFVAGMALLPHARRHLLWFAAGLAAPIALEAIVYRAWTGDALYAWKLSLGHTKIPSTELSTGVDLSRSPLFNPAYIGGWRPSSGIALHWSVDALVNLLANPAIGLTLAVALALIAFHRRALGKPEAGGRLLVFLVAAAALLFGTLVYALAIDPKPRMFMAVAAIASLCCGVLAARSWRTNGRLLVLAGIGLILVKGAIVAHHAVGLAQVERTAPTWIAERRGLAINEWSARALTLVPEARALPRHAAARPADVLIVGEGSCASAGKAAGFPGWSAVRERRFIAADLPLIAALSERRLAVGGRTVPVLCILRHPGSNDRSR